MAGAALPGSLADFGPAALAAVIVAAYLVAGEPVVGAVLHRRFEDRLRTHPGARRSFYRRLLVLEWGLTVITVVVLLAATDVGAAAVGLRWPVSWPGPVASAVCLLLLLFVVLSTRALRGGVLLDGAGSDPRRPGEPRRRPGEGRHAQSSAQATLALLPRTPAERRLFTLVGLTAGICEEWLYRGFFLAVVAAVAGGPPAWVLVLVAAVAFGLAHAYQGVGGMVLTGTLGGVFAALYLATGSLLLPVVLHAVVDLRFLLVPARALPASLGAAP